MTPSLREALAELVALKDMKDAIDAPVAFGNDIGRMEAEQAANKRLRAIYLIRKPLAWEAARRCLEAGPVETPSVHQGAAVAGAVQRPAGMFCSNCGKPSPPYPSAYCIGAAVIAATLRCECGCEQFGGTFEVRS